MSTIITRSGKGLPLTNDEVDDNFTNLNTDKAETDGATLTNVDINSGSIDGTTIGGSTAAAGTFTTVTGTSFVSSGDMTFGDNDKAIFGAGSDLQIYHAGTSSRIQDVGTGNLIIDTDGTEIQITSGSVAKYMLRAVKDGAVTTYFNGASKLATTNTGIDVTGTVTADGLTVDGELVISSNNDGVSDAATNKLILKDTDTAAINGQLMGEIQFESSDTTYPGVMASIDSRQRGTLGGGDLNFFVSPDSEANRRRGLRITNVNDIYFYEDTGTTAKLVWDASAESLGIGTTSPTGFIHTQGSSTGTETYAKFSTGPLTGDEVLTIQSNSSRSHMALQNKTGGGLVQPLALNPEGGNVGIGTSSPAQKLDVAGDLSIGIGAANANNYLLRIRAGTTGLSRIIAADTSDAGYIDYDHSANSYNFYTAGTERMRIDSTGNVGIGTTSPTRTLSVVSSSQYVANFTRSSGTAYISLNDSSTTNEAYVAVGAIGNDFSVRAGNGERMRIDSSGNVGIRTDSPEAQLHVYQPSGQTGFYLTRSATIAGGPAVGITADSAAGRINAYGTGLRFFTGASGGSLGERMTLTSTGDLDLTTGGGDIIMANGAGIDFSASAGGGASSSILDDYEEGTFTPELADASSGGNTATIGNDQGYYTKIGNLVYITVICTDINTTGMTAGNSLYFRGMPFSATNQGELIVRFDRLTFSGAFVTLSHSSSTFGRFFETISNAEDAALTVAAIDGSASDLFISGVYRAS